MQWHNILGKSCLVTEYPFGLIQVTLFPYFSSSCCNIDVWGIFLNIILQDAPFLAFRLLIIIDYKIITYMNVFFAAKNSLVIMLQIYRLVVVHGESQKARRRERELRGRDMDEIYTISGSSSKKKGRHGGRERERSKRGTRKANLSKSRKPQRTSSSRKDTGYSTDGSESSSTSSATTTSIAPVPEPPRKSHKEKATTHKEHRKDRRDKETSSNRQQQQKKKKKPEVAVVEVEEGEGTFTDTNSVSVSEVAVVEVVKEKKN